MTTDRNRAPAQGATDRAGLCRATNKQGEACRKKALRGGLCLVHSGEQDMRAMGREGGLAIQAKRRKAQDGERQTLREHLREQAEPAKVWEAIQAGLASSSEKDKLAAAKVLLLELHEPAVERERENEADVAAARAEFLLRVEEISARRLVERGLTHPGAGRPFEGVVMFELRELAEWAGAWTPRPLEISDVTCGTCGKAGVRTVAEGETVDDGPVYCRTCKPTAEAAAAADESSPAPAAAHPPAPVEESVEEATWPRRSLT